MIDNFMFINPIELWLVIGIAFIILEITLFPGLGLLFVGFGALSTSIIIYYYTEISEYPIVLVGLLSLLWFLILWYPLKIFVYGRKNYDSRNYFGMIGTKVKVINNDIEPGSVGQVAWSGTIMNAQLLPKENTVAKIGDILYVAEVKGNVLICSKDSRS